MENADGCALRQGRFAQCFDQSRWVFPAMQFLPVPAWAYIVRAWVLAHTGATRNTAVRVALSTELVGIAGLEHYFTQSEMAREQLLSFVKGFIVGRVPHVGGG